MKFNKRNKHILCRVVLPPETLKNKLFRKKKRRADSARELGYCSVFYYLCGCILEVCCFKFESDESSRVHIKRSQTYSAQRVIVFVVFFLPFGTYIHK